MKKKFEKAELEIIEFSTDVVTTSIGGTNADDPIDGKEDRFFN